MLCGGDASSNDSMAIKLDMSNAYDQAEWPFLLRVMLKLGFRPCWIELIIKCIKFASFAFMGNGSPTCHIIPSRGLRKGNPIFPYLFMFYSEGLLGLLR